MKNTKFFLALFAAATVCLSATGQDKAGGPEFVDATELNIIGKLAPTPHPYHRIDTVVYKPFTPAENALARNSAGMAVMFRTNSTSVSVKATYNHRRDGVNMTFIAGSGYDLHIRKDGEWLYAASNATREENGVLTLITNMDGAMKECMLYLPLFSEPAVVLIGVDEGAVIEPMENPFRHKVVFFGSSFTQGASTNRAGMAYPNIIQRRTGLDVINLGMSGNSKLQPTFARVLADSDADAFVFDAFSNPSAELIEERLLPFIGIIREKHPDTPLIFMQTIYRERANFDLKTRAYEEKKRETAARMLDKAMKEYKNVYFVDVPDMTGTDHLTSTDGTHPSDMGYLRWADAVQPEILRILKKHGLE